MSQKASDYSCIPLCSDCHRTGQHAYHRLGRAAFAAWWKLDIPALVARLNAALVKAINDPEVNKKLRDAGIEPQPGSPEQLARKIEAESAIWHPLIKARGIQMN